MKTYQTNQRRRLMDFFENNPDKHFSVDEISQTINDISISSIYRNINYFLYKGTIRRFQKDNSRKSLYQYVGQGDCRLYLHLKCEVCGDIRHMDSKTDALLSAAIKENSGFHIDKSKTILVGKCLKCE